MSAKYQRENPADVVSFLEYNAERTPLIIPEYGRHLQKLIDQAVEIKDRDERNKLARREKLPPLCGGAVGFMAYDAARWFEPKLDDGELRERTDAIWMFFRNMLVFDRLKQRMEIVSIVFTDEAKGDDDKLRELYQNAVAETARLEQQLAA